MQVLNFVNLINSQIDNKLRNFLYKHFEFREELYKPLLQPDSESYSICKDNKGFNIMFNEFIRYELYNIMKKSLGERYTELEFGKSSTDINTKISYILRDMEFATFIREPFVMDDNILSEIKIFINSVLKFNNLLEITTPELNFYIAGYLLTANYSQGNKVGTYKDTDISNLLKQFLI